MNDFLENVIEGYESVTYDIQQIFSELSDEDCERKPTPDSWSPLQVIEHLNITANGYLEDVREKFMKKEKFPTGEVSEIKFTITGKILKFFGPDGKLRIKAPKILRPVKNNPERKITLEKFYNIQNEIISIIRNCKEDKIDINQIKIKSPVTSLVRVRLGEFFVFTLGHEMRHLKQIKKILNIS